MFNEIATWAKGAIEAVPDANQVYDTVRIIENTAQLEEDFGTGTQAGGVEITRGWTISVTRGVPEVDGPDKKGDVAYDVIYRGFWYITGRGASETAFRIHTKAVAGALSAEARPAALALVSPENSRRIAYPVSIDEILPVVWPLASTRRHHRATLSQRIVLREQIRT